MRASKRDEPSPRERDLRSKTTFERGKSLSLRHSQTKPPKYSGGFYKQRGLFHTDIVDTVAIAHINPVFITRKELQDSRIIGRCIYEIVMIPEIARRLVFETRSDKCVLITSDCMLDIRIRRSSITKTGDREGTIFWHISSFRDRGKFHVLPAKIRSGNHLRYTISIRNRITSGSIYGWKCIHILSICHKYIPE